MVGSLDKYGRVLIPKKVREHLGIKPQSPINIIDDGQRIIIEPVHEADGLVEKDDVLIYTGKIQGELEQEIELDRAQRLKKLLFPGEQS